MHLFGGVADVFEPVGPFFGVVGVLGEGFEAGDCGECLGEPAPEVATFG